MRFVENTGLMVAKVLVDPKVGLRETIVSPVGNY